MHPRLQPGMRENPASSRRHGLRLAASSLVNEICRTEVEFTTRALSRSPDQADAGAVGSFPYAASSNAATEENEDPAARDSASLDRGAISQGPAHAFEPLINSLDAAKLLGNIHVKTLQRYARRQPSRISNWRPLVFSRIGTGLMVAISDKFVVPSVPLEIGGKVDVQADTVSVRMYGTERQAEGPDVWALRYREHLPDGSCTHRSMIVGTVEQYATELPSQESGTGAFAHGQRRQSKRWLSDLRCGDRPVFSGRVA